MYESVARQEPLPNIGEMIEPIKIVEIGCGVSFDGAPHHQTGRMYDLPFVYHGIEIEEEFARVTSRFDEARTNEVRANAEKSGIIFGNAADLPFEDDSVDVVTMQSVFGQFTGKDYREFDNIIRFGLMEAFRVLKPGGTIAVSEVNTPWEEHYVFSYLNTFGFTVTDYQAMRKSWKARDKRGLYGRAIGEYRNVYAPENETWRKRLGQFYVDKWDTGVMSAPRQYLLVGQKQQPSTIQETLEWHEWSVAKDKFDHRDSDYTPKQKTYKYGQPVKQDYLPGMYAAQQDHVDQPVLFYMYPKHFLWG